MQYVHLGRSGVRVSRLCLGTMNFGPHTSEPDSFGIMDQALELGINFFDSANVYGWKVAIRALLLFLGSVVLLPCTASSAFCTRSHELSAGAAAAHRSIESREGAEQEVAGAARRVDQPKPSSGRSARAGSIVWSRMNSSTNSGVCSSA